MKLMQIDVKEHGKLLVASRRSAARAAAGAAPAATAIGGNTREDGPHAKPLQQ